eukprot:5818244-Amphidinium_carterae.1
MSCAISDLAPEQNRNMCFGEKVLASHEAMIADRSEHAELLHLGAFRSEQNIRAIASELDVKLGPQVWSHTCKTYHGRLTT